MGFLGTIATEKLSLSIKSWLPKNGPIKRMRHEKTGIIIDNCSNNQNFKYGTAQNPSSNPQASPLQKVRHARRSRHSIRKKLWHRNSQRIQVDRYKYRQKVDLTKYLEEAIFNFDFAFD